MPTTGNLLSERFNGGADGVAVTTGNSSITAVNAGTPTFETTDKTPVEGSAQLKIDQTVAQSVRWDFVNSGSTALYLTGYHYASALPTSASAAVLANINATTTVRAQIRYLSTGAYRLINQTATTAATTTGTWSGQDVRLRWKLDWGAGTQSLDVYVGANLRGATPDETISGALTNATRDRIVLGSLGTLSSTSGAYYLFDYVDLSDTAFTAPPPQLRTLTPAAETDTVLALGRKKSRTLTSAGETDTAVTLAKTDRIERTLTPATETDAVVVAGRTKRRTLSPAAETDTAVALAKTDQIWRSLTVTTETDAVVTLGRRKSRTLASAAETAVAVTLSKTDRIERPLTPAAETDTAVTVTGGTTAPGTIVRDLTPAAETDTAQTLGRTKSKALTAATETGSVVALGRGESKALSPASESDAVNPTGRTKARSLTAASETETIVHLTAVSIRTLTAAAETEAAAGLAHVKSKTLAPAPETDAAWTLVGAVGTQGEPVDNPVLILTTGQGQLSLAETTSELALTTATSVLTVTENESPLVLTTAQSTLDLTGGS